MYLEYLDVFAWDTKTEVSHLCKFCVMQQGCPAAMSLHFMPFQQSVSLVAT